MWPPCRARPGRSCKKKLDKSAPPCRSGNGITRKELKQIAFFWGCYRSTLEVVVTKCGTDLIVKTRRKPIRLRHWQFALSLLAVTAGVLFLRPDYLKTRLTDTLSASNSPAGQYRATDRWRADVRTALAVADYLFSPDNPTPMTPLLVTNYQSDDSADQPLSATNATRVEVGNPS